MVGESDTVSPTFSYVRNSLYWVAGLLFIFFTIALFGSLLNQSSGGSNSRDAAGNPVRRPGTPSRGPSAEPSLGLTPQTATAGQ